jgi:hypothetical protein
MAQAAAASQPGFVADVPTAIQHLTKTLDWLVTPIKQGGVGYTVAKAKASNAHAALVALGGSWR